MGLLDKVFGPPSKKKFADRLIEALQRAGDTRKISFDPGEFRLIFSNEQGSAGEMNLGNLYLEYCRVTKKERRRCLGEMVRAALSHLKEMPEEFEEAAYDIRPRLWTRATIEQLRLRRRIEGGADSDWPLEPIGEHLYLSLVYDLPESVRSLSNEDLEKWGVTYWEAREIAIRNLAECKFVYANVGGEMFASNTGDSYDATRLILPELFEDFGLTGELVAMVPNRDTMLITSTDSEVGLKMMLEFATSQIREAPRPLMAYPLVLAADGDWTDWVPQDTHPLANEFRKTTLGWTQIEYAEQAALLKKVNEIEQNDEYIASFDILEKEGRFTSYCVWAKDVQALLPKTDLIAFFQADSGDEPLVLDFADALEELNHLFEPTDHYPTRFRVRDFPSDDALKYANARPMSELG